MPKTEGPPPSYPKQRRYRRFNLRCPVRVSFPRVGMTREVEGTCENVSIGGILVTASNQIPPRTRVRLTMEVSGPSSRRPLQFLGDGEVVRVERGEDGSGFSIAIECRCPIAQVEIPVAS